MVVHDQGTALLLLQESIVHGIVDGEKKQRMLRANCVIAGAHVSATTFATMSCVDTPAAAARSGTRSAFSRD
jgi:hypothetical protein